MFRGLIILSNKSPNHNLNDVEIAVYSTWQNKNQTKTLTKKVIQKIEKGGSYSHIVEIRADFTDTYVIEIKAQYRSDYFRDKLKHMDIDSMSPSQKAKMQNKESYRIDYQHREVTRNFSKKFKFQTRSPFQLSQNIVVRQNKYFMEITLENESSQLFLQAVTLKLSNTDLDWLDLNHSDEEGEMVGSFMKKKEK